MTESEKKVRAVVAVPLAEELCGLIEELEPRLEVVHDAALVPPMRGPADWSGDPEFSRTPEQQRAFDDLVDSADVLFGIPDVDPQALARTVSANPGLRWVMTTAAGGGSTVKAAGLDRADLDRIVFTTSAGVHGGTLAEFALFAVLAGAKGLPRLLDDQRKRTWPDRWEMRQVDEMTVLVVGVGGIGAECARRFHALGARVWGTSRSGRAVEGVDRLIAPDELVDAVGEVDAIVVTLPGTEQTRHLIGEEVLRAVKPGVILTNVGRGSVVDETALLAALDDGRVGFAGLDVFEQEPLPADSPLWTHPRVLVSPHTAALSSKEEERIARRFAENATRLLDGRELRAVVDTVEFY
ncbi:D-2-hydroxyacid dehydrogenase [Microbacterium sp. p3-SID338]|uniref:D-2-hydroxyacid dehydrogenase n=1 Tax=unclassified Microbacterium TaxID=2609290 RepID=UPI00078919EA|nr:MULTISPECIES: D-2-hydroxyacid dehydrogenase [unclassified Microbacterium]KYJ97696.1 hydroxyacid dehydrogenase [Microbacterium sp. CH1]MCT1395557.1 D-2-hydroxyacid dehydrogenase [Microbacterium sp. p3-SID338]PMC04302.1 D-2-hydroxyacid dehydrogenase [Microbacterium sp. UMB0228]